MLSLVNYCEERYNTFDVKFKDLNDKELEDCKRILEYILDESNYKSIIVDYAKDIYINYGDIYYIEFKNPFADNCKFSASSTEQISLDNEQQYIKCIGIGDKFGRIFLQNVWDNKNPAYIEYRKSKTCKTKEGKTFNTKDGWFITRKDIEAYKVREWNSKNEEKTIYIPEKIKRKGVYGIIIEINVVKNISKILQNIGI